MTPKTIAALRVIRDYPGIDSASSFGHLYFGHDHPGWRRHGKVGRGVAAGVGLNLAAGGYLGKLKKAGLITTRRTRRLSTGHIEWEYCLTDAGAAALAAAEGEGVK